MAWLRTDGKVAISQRRATSYTTTTVTDKQSDLTLDSTSGIQANTNKLMIIFKLPSSIDGSNINLKSSNFIWALHTSSRPPDDPYTMQIDEHDGRGHVVF